MLAESERPTGGYTCGGSSTSFPGRFTDFSNFDFTIANAQGGIRPYVGANGHVQLRAVQLFPAPGQRAIWPTSSRTTTRSRTCGSTPNSTSWTTRRTSQIAPSGAFLQPFTLTNANPLLSQQFKDAVGISAANPDVDLLHRPPQRRGRRAHGRHRAHRATASSAAPRAAFFDDKWDYNAWWQFGKMTPDAHLPERLFGRAAGTGIERRDRARREPGQPVCASVLDGTDPNCVPYNIFATGGVTPGRPRLPADAGPSDRRHEAGRGRVQPDVRPGHVLWLDAARGRGTASASRSASSTASSR